jgi:hypothetical protein
MACYESLSNTAGGVVCRSRTALHVPIGPHPVVAGMVLASQHNLGGALHLLAHHTNINSDQNGSTPGGSTHYRRRYNRHGGSLGSWLSKAIHSVGKFFTSNLGRNVVNLGRQAWQTATDWSRGNRDELEASRKREHPMAVENTGATQ